VNTFQEAATTVRGRLVSGGQGTWRGVSTDTRALAPGSLFVALKGNRFDGHQFVSEAFAQGAAGAVVSAIWEDWKRDAACAQKPLILVDDTLEALGALAAAHRAQFQIPVMAVTGSTGKTTTKDMTAHVLGKSREVLRTAENYNNEIGVPLALLSLTNSHRVAVIEMAMRGRGQIRYLAEMARPSIGIITNIGPSHLELLGDLESVAQAKGELLECIGSDGIAVLNADDSYLPSLRSLATGRVITFGIERPADFRALEPSVENGGRTGFRLACADGNADIVLPLPGRHAVYNALAAAAAVAQVGVDPLEALGALADFEPGPGRLRLLRARRGFSIIDDCYNASPASMAAALAVLADLPAEHKYAALGDMRELGREEIAFHREAGVAAAGVGLDLLVTVGDLARHIGLAAAEVLGTDRVVAAEDNDTAADILLAQLTETDAVLIKGSRAMGMEHIVKRLADA